MGTMTTAYTIYSQVRYVRSGKWKTEKQRSEYEKDYDKNESEEKVKNESQNVLPLFLFNSGSFVSKFNYP